MGKLTPAMQQFMDIKNEHPDAIVFFRMGDFYETFFEDAKVTAKTLDIALTKRGKNGDQAIPLAGIPYHALDAYLGKMVKAGHKVVIVEQLEDPKFAKGVVKRGVARIITPGTVIESKLLEETNNFIAAFVPGKVAGLAYVDVSTGECKTLQTASPFEYLHKISPAEIIIPTSFEEGKTYQLLKQKYYVTTHSDVFFYNDNAQKQLMQHFQVASLDGFGLRGKEQAINAAGGLLSYLSKTQKIALHHVSSISLVHEHHYLYLDTTSIQNLEILENLRGSNDFTVFKTLNNTQTTMGHRRLRHWLVHPLKDPSLIQKRLNSVSFFFEHQFIMQEVMQLLKNIADIERLVARVHYNRTSPRDLIQLQASLEILPKLKDVISSAEDEYVEQLCTFKPFTQLIETIDNGIIDEPPLSIAEGGFIKKGYDEQLDEFKQLMKNAKQLLAQLEDKERERTGIKSLKIKYNRVFGYFIDVTNANLHLVPDDYIKKQTLSNSERFVIEELKVLEEKILHAKEKSIALEQELFAEMVAQVQEETIALQKVADQLATLDVLCSFAHVSLEWGYVKPQLHAGTKLVIKEGRHPIMEQITDFIPNDVELDGEVMIITGPNMAGKSSFMRQVALVCLFAHMGCFVPAKDAFIPLLDHIFCRTGAVDDITQGQSTFMVEMAQTAQILNQANDRSLVILDEIGRGTSTYDGVAIAWAVAEYLAQHNVKTLFATHYHVLNELAQHHSNIINYNIAVQEEEDDIVFLRKIVQGGTNKSYGIHVAKIAGMPKEVIEKSKSVQFKLESDDHIKSKIVVEHKKKQHYDMARDDVEEVETFTKSRQVRLDEL